MSAITTKNYESRIDFEVNQTSHGFAVGDPVYHNGTNYVDSDAVAESSSEVLGIVSKVADSNNFTLQTAGRLTGLSSLTAGTVYFLASGGGLTTTPADISKPVYYAISTTEAIFLPYRGSQLASGGGSGGGALEARISIFASSGTPLYENAINISSVTDNGVGLYTINFTNAFADANYTITIGYGHQNGNQVSYIPAIYTVTTSGFNIHCTDLATSKDPYRLYLMVSGTI